MYVVPLHILYPLTTTCRLFIFSISNTDEQALLKRLKYAFLHGLTFNVGTSLTTGLKKSVHVGFHSSQNLTVWRYSGSWIS